MAVHITQSELTAYATCPWLWKKRYVELKRPKRKSVKLSFGGAMHKGVETFYARKGDPLEAVKIYCDKVRAKAEESGVLLDQDYDLWLKKAEIMTEGYIKHYEEDFEKYSILSVEPSFSIPLIDDIMVDGKIDRITTEKRTGFFIPVETKTVAAWNPDINRLMLDFQISVYSWAISKMLHLHDVTFLYDIILKPMLKLKASESEEGHLIRLKADVMDHLPEYFKRDRVTRSRAEIERTERELVLRCRELVRMRESEVYRTPGEHCHWACEMMPGCIEDTPDIWNALYTTAETAHEELIPDREV